MSEHDMAQAVPRILRELRYAEHLVAMAEGNDEAKARREAEWFAAEFNRRCSENGFLIELPLAEQVSAMLDQWREMRREFHVH
ncbi:hypothetical protein [Sinorhizobium fredii]|uniref:hypothetical protein n=1 Tax=Rhizobium fredii TaxID=380 RepID=UPI003517EDFC